MLTLGFAGEQGTRMTIPNYITILRLLLVPVVIWAMLDGREAVPPRIAEQVHALTGLARD